MLSVFCVLQTRTVLWEPLCPRHRESGGAGARCGHCCRVGRALVCVTTGVQVGLRLRGAHSQGIHSWQVPGLSLEPAAAWQHRNSHWKLEGKRVKELPFHLKQICKNIWKRKGHQECCWEEGQLFVFCPPTEYNLFKYLHVLLLKDFLLLPVFFWLLSYEWWR